MKTRIANRSYGREYEELETYTVGMWAHTFTRTPTHEMTNMTRNEADDC